MGCSPALHKGIKPLEFDPNQSLAIVQGFLWPEFGFYGALAGVLINPAPKIPLTFTGAVLLRQGVKGALKFHQTYLN